MHPERAIAAQRRYRAAHPDRVEASAAQYREAHRQEQRDRTRAWRQKPESTEKRRAVRQRQIAEGKHSARMAVQRAIKRGEITPEPCFRCGATPAEAHHYLGYVREHWLHVIWCCDLHHAQVHAALRRAADAAGSHVGMVT